MEYTLIGDAVNRACHYGDGAGPGEILISPEVFAKAWDRVQIMLEATMLATNHEGNWTAYRIKEAKGHFSLADQAEWDPAARWS